jgi:hypothetical protein
METSMLGFYNHDPTCSAHGLQKSYFSVLGSLSAAACNISAVAVRVTDAHIGRYRVAS